MTTLDVVVEARDAIARGDWKAAFERLRTEDATGALTPAGILLLAEAAYGAGDLEATIDAYERARAASLETGDRVAAATAAVNVAMYLMMDTGLMAPVRGWLRRAERDLGDDAEGPLHAWLAMVSAYERLMSGDVEGTALHARRAVDLGTRHDQLAPATIGKIAAARVEILSGEVAAGLELLDEAAIPVVSGELDPLPTGMAYCELICAMQGLGQYERAEEWTTAMELWRHGVAFGGINGRCRVHRAEILRLRGSCDQAEDEALHACAELRPWMRREFGWPLTELGTIRLRRGDLTGAEEAFLAAHAHGWDPQPGLALLRLAEGDVTGAVASIRDALRHPPQAPSKERPPNTELWRAPLLDAQGARGSRRWPPRRAVSSPRARARPTTPSVTSTTRCGPGPVSGHPTRRRWPGVGSPRPTTPRATRSAARSSCVRPRRPSTASARDGRPPRPGVRSRASIPEPTGRPDATSHVARWW